MEKAKYTACHQAELKEDVQKIYVHRCIFYQNYNVDEDDASYLC